MICVCGHSQNEHLNSGHGACLPDGGCDRFCERFEPSQDEEGDVDLKYYADRVKRPAEAT